jgi:hypothetical protein
MRQTISPAAFAAFLAVTFAAPANAQSSRAGFPGWGSIPAPARANRPATR